MGREETAGLGAGRAPKLSLSGSNGSNAANDVLALTLDDDGATENAPRSPPKSSSGGALGMRDVDEPRADELKKLPGREGGGAGSSSSFSSYSYMLFLTCACACSLATRPESPSASRSCTLSSGAACCSCCSPLLRADADADRGASSGAGVFLRPKRRPKTDAGCGSGEVVRPDSPCWTSSTPSEFGSSSTVVLSGSSLPAATRLSQLLAAGRSASPLARAPSCSVDGRDAALARAAALRATLADVSLADSTARVAVSSAVLRKRKIEARPDLAAGLSSSAGLSSASLLRATEQRQYIAQSGCRRGGE